MNKYLSINTYNVRIKSEICFSVSVYVHIGAGTCGN